MTNIRIISENKNRKSSENLSNIFETFQAELSGKLTEQIKKTIRKSFRFLSDFFGKLSEMFRTYFGFLFGFLSDSFWIISENKNRKSSRFFSDFICFSFSDSFIFLSDLFLILFGFLPEIFRKFFRNFRRKKKQLFAYSYIASYTYILK